VDLTGGLDWKTQYFGWDTFLPSSHPTPMRDGTQCDVLATSVVAHEVWGLNVGANPVAGWEPARAVLVSPSNSVTCTWILTLCSKWGSQKMVGVEVKASRGTVYARAFDAGYVDGCNAITADDVRSDWLRKTAVPVASGRSAPGYGVYALLLSEFLYVALRVDRGITSSAIMGTFAATSASCFATNYQQPPGHHSPVQQATRQHRMWT
jgi:hypothetical protein